MLPCLLMSIAVPIRESERVQMTGEQRAIVEQVKQQAHNNFSAGFNCAECVTEAAWSFIETDLPADAWKLATGFGGGLGLYGDTCGALTGAILAVGAVHGRGTLPVGTDRRDILARSRVQLYDLNIDVGESNNLSEKHPEIVKELSSQVTGWYDTMPK